MPRILDARLETRAPSTEPRLDGSGLVVVNPPFTLVDELKLLLPALAETLADVPGTARWHVAWLAGEAPPEG
jgi:23S rRNA (adenine2030-N6)-methyltransferase